MIGSEREGEASGHDVGRESERRLRECDIRREKEGGRRRTRGREIGCEREKRRREGKRKDTKQGVRGIAKTGSEREGTKR